MCVAMITPNGLRDFLTQPLHPVTRHLERSWWMFFVVIYVLSFGLSLITYFLYGFWPGESDRLWTSAEPHLKLNNIVVL
jgi:hypothetical protein